MRWLYEEGWGKRGKREGACALVSICKFAPSRKLLYRLSGTFTHATRPLPLSIKENIKAIHFGVSMAYKHDRRKIQIAEVIDHDNETGRDN